MGAQGRENQSEVSTAFKKSASTSPLSLSFQNPARSRLRVLWTLRLLRSGFEPLTQGFSVLCSNQLSYLNHFPKVCVFFIEERPTLPSSGGACSRTESRPVPGRPSFGQVFFAIDATKRFFLSRNFARPFNFRAGGNGIRTHDTIFLYVDLANQCLKPLSHTSKLLIGIGSGLVGCPKGYLIRSTA